jgi:bisanhydrobacterioruberin hydratase
VERQTVVNKYFFIIFYMVGVVGHILPVTRPFMLSLTPYVLLITGIIIFYPVIKNNQLKLFIFFALCGLIAFFAEVVGVNFGTLFGDYFYGEILGIKILAVPLIIIVNWMIILIGSISLSGIISKNKATMVILSTLFALIFDYIMEPVAIYFKYWNWESGYVPFMNYFTWGIMIFIFTSVYVFNRFRIKSSIPAFIFVIQILYFLLLRLAIYSDIIH